MADLRRNTLRVCGFSYRPYLVKNVYFCEHVTNKVTTYITWVNNQLSRDNGYPPITSLERGLSDGVTLPRLLSILGDDPVPGVVIPPRSDAVRKQNIRLCFQYLQLRHIHPRNSTAPDVSNGNLKCIMRLLLALAANFKTYRSENRIIGFPDMSPNGLKMKPGSLASPEELNWMYGQVIDTRKQIESLKHLLLKDTTDEEKVLIGNQLALELDPVPCSQCDAQEIKYETIANQLTSTEQTLAYRDKQIMDLKAEILHLKTRDKFLSSEVDDRNQQISKLKILLDKIKNAKEHRRRDDKTPLLWQQQSNHNTTKILYYLGNNTTPYLSQIYKRPGQITLRDFIAVINRPGSYRYNFKSYDREFGPVKEEVLSEDAVLPTWDGRIVGFVEAQSSSLEQIEI